MFFNIIDFKKILREVGVYEKISCCSVFFQVVLLWGFSSRALAHTDVNIPDANAMIASNPDLIIVDVRELSEYCGELGHIYGAYLYPWNSAVFQDSYGNLLPDDEILIVCRSGGRSNSEASFLDSKGYMYVYDLVGGTTGCKNTYGYDTVDCVDTDSDGFNDDLDNCPNIYNPLQTDSDDDGMGNACDNDCPNLDVLNPVNFFDFAILASNWQFSGPQLAGDLDADEFVDINDVTIFAYYWLSECYE